MSVMWTDDEYKRRIVDKIVNMVRKELYKNWDKLPIGDLKEENMGEIEFVKEKEGFGVLRCKWSPHKSGGLDYFAEKVYGVLMVLICVIDAA